MNARVPKGMESLTPVEKDRLKEYVTDIVLDQVNRNLAEAQRLYIRLSILNLHDGFGFGEGRLTVFLGSFKRLYHYYERLAKEGREQELADKVDKIFHGDFPEEFLKGL